VIDPDPKDRKPNYSWKQNLVRHFILANPGATINDVVKATRTAPRTVSRVRQDMIREELIAPAATGRPTSPGPSQGPSEGPDVDEQIRKDIDAAIMAGKKVLTREERRQRLSAYADHPKVPTQAKIAALKELEATEPPEDDKVLGPGAPLTKADRIVRGALVIEALADIDGQGAVMEALARGLGEAYVKFTDTIAFAKGPDASPAG
jgi:hypothetical protein